MDGNASKTRKLVSLFVVTALAVGSAGCTRSANANECYDNNNDGYCDDDGSSYVGSSYYYRNGNKVYTKSSAGISSGTKSSGISSGSKSGIGSSSSSSGG